MEMDQLQLKEWVLAQGNRLAWCCQSTFLFTCKGEKKGGLALALVPPTCTPTVVPPIRLLTAQSDDNGLKKIDGIFLAQLNNSGAPNYMGRA